MGGNACWKQEETKDSFFKPRVPLSKFTIRDYKDYNKTQFYPERQFIKRINGELCTYNLIEIIKRYKPKYYIIENPASSKIWEYIEKILGFEIEYENKTFYNNYDYLVKKPTKFKSNLDLNLKNENKQGKVKFRDFPKDYNERSNIPLKLVREIFNKVLERYNKDKEY